MTQKEKTTFTTKDGENILVPNHIWIAIKSGDSYYQSLIPSQYHRDMHDTRGLLQVFESKEEAEQQLYDWCLEEDDDNWVYNDAHIAELQECGEDISWYVGEGIYRGHELVFQLGDHSYENDLRYYNIRPLVDELAEMQEKGSLWELANVVNDSSYFGRWLYIVDQVK